MTTSAMERQTTGWTVDDSTFAARLALVRMRMGWNMKEAARECGLNAQTWRLWEIDGTLPRRHVEIAKAIATRTGCDFMWLLVGPEGGDGGGAETTRQYLPEAHVVATVGEPHASSRARPVRRTRPVAGRPMTPVAA